MLMTIDQDEMKRANPHVHTFGRNYTATVANETAAIALADKLHISYFDLDGVFYGRTAKRWNKVY